MTDLTKTVKRSLVDAIDREMWNVEIGRDGITFRRKGSRKRYPTVPWGKVWRLAMELEAQRVRLEKAAKRKAKKAGV